MIDATTNLLLHLKSEPFTKENVFSTPLSGDEIQKEKERRIFARNVFAVCGIGFFVLACFGTLLTVLDGKAFLTIHPVSEHPYALFLRTTLFSTANAILITFGCLAFRVSRNGTNRIKESLSDADEKEMLLTEMIAERNELVRIIVHTIKSDGRSLKKGEVKAILDYVSAIADDGKT